MKHISKAKYGKISLNFNQRILEIAETWGADYTGIANLYSARDYIQQQGGEIISGYPLAISVGITMLNTIVDQLADRTNRTVALSYQYHSYDLINQRLDLLTSHISKYIQREGYNALPIPASECVNDEDIHGIFSHKLAARLAGFGWIGKNCLLVTPDAGPRVRWGTVLTDAPLHVTGEVLSDRCGNCTKCVDICPVKAIKGKPFHPDDPLEERYDAVKCYSYYESMRNESPEHIGVCALCLYICPYGKKDKHELPVLKKIK